MASKRKLHAPDWQCEGEPLCTLYRSLPLAQPGDTIDCTTCIGKLNEAPWMANKLIRDGYVIGRLPDRKPRKPKAPAKGSAVERTMALGDLLS